MKILLTGSGRAKKNILLFFKNYKQFKIKNIKNFFSYKNNILLDFSNRSKIKFILKKCILKNIKIIIGTTGYNDNDLSIIKKVSKIIPIFMSSNFSKSFKTFTKVVNFVKKKFYKYDTSIVETHNLNKEDFPSGSSKILSNIVNPVSINSIRYSNVLGKHKIFFYKEGISVVLEHICSRNDIFSLLIKAIKFIKKKKKGFFSIKYD
ncbi:dihydrodipicolinate reductase C-terminal domain-containing protein [Candidatus Vidania fulgoroideorum]